MSRKYPGDNEAVSIFSNGYCYHKYSEQHLNKNLPSKKYQWIYDIGVSEFMWEIDTNHYNHKNKADEILERINIIRAL